MTGDDLASHSVAVATILAEQQMLVTGGGADRIFNPSWPLSLRMRTAIRRSSAVQANRGGRGVAAA